MRGFTALRCSFDGANFEGLFMQMAVFDGCNFIQANLHKVYAEFSHFTSCILIEADLSDADLLGANLANSSFHKANFQGAHLGKPALMLFPGLGNPERYFTKIDGASFDGADFRDIYLDDAYSRAPNFQEPLRRIWLLRIRDQFVEATERAQSNIEKMRSLESLTASIIDQIIGLQVQAEDKRRKTSEIDLIVQNRSVSLATAGLAGPIFVECRNTKKPVQAKDIRDFFGKLPVNSIGLFVTTNRLSKDAEGEMRIHNGEKGIRLLYWNRSNLEKITKGEETPEDQFIESYYNVLSL